jgi:hypothetical protein
MRRQGHQAFVGELSRFAANAADERLMSIAERTGAPLRVAVRGRRGVGCSVVARALNLGAPAEPEGPEMVVYVIAEVVKPEDVQAVQALPHPVLAVLNKADVTGFAGDGPMALARERCEYFSALLGVPVEPMSGLLAVAAQSDGVEHARSGTLGPFGGAVAVAAVRQGKTAAQVRALLRLVSGVDAVLDRLDTVGAEVRYRRVLDAVAELEALAISDGAVGGFLARDYTVLARMAAAIDVAESAGLDVEPCRDRAGYLSRAVRWQRYGRAHASAMHRACGADIARGSLRLWSGEAG